jgi:F-type H+-transporting ATPase subunit delta
VRASAQSEHFARQLFHLSLVDGRVSDEHVTAVLAHLTEHPPRQPVAVLKTYRRLVLRQLARNQALVSHAGVLGATILSAIEEAFSRKYQRPIAATARPDAALLAGLRIRIGDDVYESSIASQLAALSGPA